MAEVQIHISSLAQQWFRIGNQDMYCTKGNEITLNKYNEIKLH
jgi:hypothetical protein